MLVCASGSSLSPAAAAVIVAGITFVQTMALEWFRVAGQRRARRRRR